jgi:hypothetical protein
MKTRILVQEDTSDFGKLLKIDFGFYESGSRLTEFLQANCVPKKKNSLPFTKSECII